MIDGLRPTRADRSLAPRLGLALIAGPTAWMARLLISLSLISHACESEMVWLLHLLSLAFALVAAAALVVSVRCRRKAVGQSAGERRDRSRFVALLAVAVNAASLLAIVLESLAIVIIDPCLR
jgi:hypothetical protein